MRYYPILLDLKGKHCLVVGAGRVGVRKIAALLESGPQSVLVLDSAMPNGEHGKTLLDLLKNQALTFEEREFRLQDLEGCFVVVAATSNTKLNREIAVACHAQKILCNVVDDPDAGNFIVPATVCRGDLTLTISTCGQSPALSRVVRQELEESFGSEYALLLTILGRLRSLLLGLDLPTRENTRIFREITGSDLLRHLETNDAEAVFLCLKRILPTALHPNLPELLDGIV